MSSLIYSEEWIVFMVLVSIMLVYNYSIVLLQANHDANTHLSLSELVIL